MPLSNEDLRRQLAGISIQDAAEVLEWFDYGGPLKFPRRGFKARNECECGNCPRCTRDIERQDLRRAINGCCGQKNCDCAEWDRIYRDVFEDPTYYTRPESRDLRGPASSLAYAIKFFPPLDDATVRPIRDGSDRSARLRSIVNECATAASARRLAAQRG